MRLKKWSLLFVYFTICLAACQPNKPEPTPKPFTWERIKEEKNIYELDYGIHFSLRKSDFLGANLNESPLSEQICDKLETNFFSAQRFCVTLGASRHLYKNDYANLATVTNKKTKVIYTYPVLDYLTTVLPENNIPSDTNFYTLDKDTCFCWLPQGDFMFRQDALNQPKGTLQGDLFYFPISSLLKPRLKNGKKFEVFEFKNKYNIKVLNELLLGADSLSLKELELLLQSIQSFDLYCNSRAGDLYHVLADSIFIYYSKTRNLPISKINGWANNRANKNQLDSVLLAGSGFRWDEENQHLGVDTFFYKHRFKFVSLTPAQVRTMRLPALCPPRDSLTAIADYIDQTQPTFIFFKKYFQSCEPTYNYFLLYYFDFPEGKAPILRDIRVVVPDNFGLNISPN
jgi:hypothetical protein